MTDKHMICLGKQISDKFQNIRDQNLLVRYMRLRITAASNMS